ncbi:MAG: adenylate/guanylate cyclase domain-containing protein [Treponema sp.]|nr:adenylate/guanylate cyclase domain-containing protein [Treponema sp.]
MKKILISIIIPIIAVALCSLLMFSPLDYKVADYFQRPLKSTEESPEVLMIAVDDDAVEKIGSWPFSRTVYSQMLANLKELGARSVVFDLSFLDHSQATVDETYVREYLPGYVEDYFGLLYETADEYFEALADGDAEYDEASEVYDSESRRYALELNTAISHVINPVDEVLASSIKDFGNTYLTLTFEDGIQTSDLENEFLSNYIALSNVSADKDTITKEYTGVTPALYDFITQAKSAGFVNADPDVDGYLRHVNLVVKYNGKYYAQLVFRPILEQLGNPKVEITNDYIKVGTLKIPRSKDGSIIIKYPKKHFVDYNKISLANIYFLSTMENTFLKNLTIMNNSGFFEDLEPEENPYDLWETADYIRQELSYGEAPEDGITYDAYLEYRQLYFQASKDFLNGDAEAYFCELYEDDVDYIHDLFAEAKSAYEKYMESHNKYAAIVKDAMCIVGTNASSTTDYGINQYEEHYPNPGMHYALANMILSNDFVDDSPVWISIIIALVMCFAYSLVTYRIKRTTPQIIIGVVAVVLTGGALLLYFLLTRQYIGTVIPVVSVFVSFVATTVAGFITANHDKRFITNAFSQCLSKEVVNEIVANPSSFKLGGQRLEMTAMFTDIQKFSGFSELLTAGQLVALLNYYLTKMSDIIMEERGTVDKYEGDAIIALVGAPVQMEDHAQRACAAAIKMKAAEAQMNKEILEIAAAEEKPADMDDELYDAFKIMVANKRKLFTRIGLNSGEMIAGYMGSENKKNYTMMGNNVNLASRLEGVNKQYCTGGIMISAATRALLGDRFIVRSLDCVRVVNVNTPIRLYELICEREDASAGLISYYEKWENALADFENKNYARALEKFKILHQHKQDDNVAAYYIKITEDFFIQGKYPTEQDDVGVAYNPKDGVFKLLQK